MNMKATDSRIQILKELAIAELDKQGNVKLVVWIKAWATFIWHRSISVIAPGLLTRKYCCGVSVLVADARDKGLGHVTPWHCCFPDPFRMCYHSTRVCLLLQPLAASAEKQRAAFQLMLGGLPCQGLRTALIMLLKTECFSVGKDLPACSCSGWLVWRNRGQWQCFNASVLLGT